LGIRVETRSNEQALDIAMMEAAKRRKFEPWMDHGVPVESYVRVPFTLMDSP
jgi:hypothetical protein